MKELTVIMKKLEDIQPYAEFDENTKLIEEDILDSMSILVLTQELEEEFNIDIDMEEITREIFATAMTIAGFVAEKRKM